MSDDMTKEEQLRELRRIETRWLTNKRIIDRCQLQSQELKKEVDAIKKELEE